MCQGSHPALRCDCQGQAQTHLLYVVLSQGWESTRLKNIIVHAGSGGGVEGAGAAVEHGFRAAAAHLPGGQQRCSLPATSPCPGLCGHRAGRRVCPSVASLTPKNPLRGQNAIWIRSLRAARSCSQPKLSATSQERKLGVSRAGPCGRSTQMVADSEASLYMSGSCMRACPLHGLAGTSSAQRLWSALVARPPWDAWRLGVCPA